MTSQGTKALTWLRQRTERMRAGVARAKLLSLLSYVDMQIGQSATFNPCLISQTCPMDCLGQVSTLIKNHQTRMKWQATPAGQLHTQFAWNFPPSALSPFFRTALTHTWWSPESGTTRHYNIGNMHCTKRLEDCSRPVHHCTGQHGTLRVVTTAKSEVFETTSL